VKKLVVLALLLGLLVVGDRVAKSIAESKIEERAATVASGGVGAAATISAHIDSFPFVARLLLSGDAGNIELHADRVANGTITLSALDLRLDGVRLNKDVLLSSHRAELTSIDHGVVTASLTAPDLSKVVGVPVTIGDGKVSVTVRGRTVAAEVVAAGDGIELRINPLPAFKVPFAKSDLLPCGLADGRVQGDRLILTCKITEVPPALFTFSSP
jgi:hypothetical protein